VIHGHSRFFWHAAVLSVRASVAAVVLAITGTAPEQQVTSLTPEPGS
jgi:hypothetical protein